MKKRVAIIALSLLLVFASVLSACSQPAATATPTAAGTETAAPATTAPEATPAEPKIFKTVESFPYPSLDLQKDYYSWHNQFYGISESLFKINDDLSISPWLAEGIEIAENVATVTLKDGVCFSNGNPVTTAAVVKSLQRLMEVNNRYAYMAEWTFETPDDKTLVITTPAVYPTIVNDLANPETGIIDIDGTTDFDNNPICTGPFVVKEFVPEGDLTVERNVNYWGGEVKLDGAVFYAMGDEAAKLLAMQNGEIDGYVDIAAASKEIYAAEPDKYTVTTIPTERRTFALLNSAKLSDSVREAICIGIDKESLALYLNGLVSPAVGAFSASAAYGSVTAPATDVAKAKQVLEADGYTLNAATNVYEKDGNPLTVTISCYAKRSIDTIAVLMQEQLKAIGITTEVAIVEDPDGTYISNKDFDIGLYNMITDKTGDPLTFITGAVQSGVYLDVCGFGNSDTDALIEQLRYAIGSDARAALANQIMEQVYAANDYLFLVTYNKNTVLRAGASGLSETSPFGFYGISATTDLQ